MLVEENFKKIPKEEMLDRITNFVQHLQREDHFDDDAHQQSLDSLENEFHSNNVGPKRNAHLSVRPAEMYTACDAPCPWSKRGSAVGSTQSWDHVWKEAHNFQQIRSGCAIDF